MRISDWSSDVCSSDLSAGNRHRLYQHGADLDRGRAFRRREAIRHRARGLALWHRGLSRNQISLHGPLKPGRPIADTTRAPDAGPSTGMRSEEHTSELQSLMRISYAVFCLKKKKIQTHSQQQIHIHK